jgi:GTP:adenosylcobinamide-phosphate guanylyltransferase
LSRSAISTTKNYREELLKHPTFQVLDYQMAIEHLQKSLLMIEGDMISLKNLSLILLQLLQVQAQSATVKAVQQLQTQIQGHISKSSHFNDDRD